MSQLSVVIAEDEPLARDKLRRLIAAEPNLSLIGEAVNGTDAISMIDELVPDLVFLDIKMPGATGIQVAQTVRHKPYVIFTTAFDEFAVTAFELHAIDYLLKPFARTRFRDAVSRIDSERHPLGERIASAVEEPPLRQLFVRDRKRLITIPVDTISRIEAADDYAEVFSAAGKHLVRIRLKLLEQRLDPTRFVRIHRSMIVNLDRVSEISSCGNGRYEVVLDDGTLCTASRTGAAKLRKHIR